MDPAAPARIGTDRSHVSMPRWQAAALLIALGIFLASDIALHPIVLWDESRLAVNALEMSRRGFSLVTTYGFQPDLWNTKPPLLIWLEASSIRLFGPSEWAIRLPSLLAALVTVGLVMRFSWRLGRSRFVAFAAPLFLALSPGYFGAHAAKSGDYEALLCLFTTAYLLLLFELIHRRRPDPGRVILCGLLVAAACLTKGIAGLVPGVGVAAYVLVRGRWPRLFRTPWYALAALIALALVGAFYLLRERAGPGYLAAVMREELAGRYLHAMPGHIQPPLYYVRIIFDLFSFGPALILLLISPFLRWRATKSAAFLGYANCVSLGILLAYSLGGTKIFWYVVPIYPILSISLAVLFERLLRLIPRYPLRRVQAAHVLMVIILLYMVGAAFFDRYRRLPPIENIPQSRYGLVFAQLNREGFRHVKTIDGGVYNDDGLIDYTPQRWFYSLAWIQRGLDIRAVDPNQPATAEQGDVLVTCDQDHLVEVRALGRPVATVADCAATIPVAPPSARKGA